MTLFKKILWILGIGGAGAYVYKQKNPEWNPAGLLPPKLPNPKKWPNSDYAQLYEMTGGEKGLVPVGVKEVQKKPVFGVRDKSVSPRTHWFYKDTGNYQ